jgi:hypothetical protein
MRNDQGRSTAHPDLPRRVRTLGASPACAVRGRQQESDLAPPDHPSSPDTAAQTPGTLTKAWPSKSRAHRRPACAESITHPPDSATASGVPLPPYRPARTLHRAPSPHLSAASPRAAPSAVPLRRTPPPHRPARTPSPHLSAASPRAAPSAVPLRRTASPAPLHRTAPPAPLHRIHRTSPPRRPGPHPPPHRPGTVASRNPPAAAGGRNLATDLLRSPEIGRSVAGGGQRSPACEHRAHPAREAGRGRGVPRRVAAGLGSWPHRTAVAETVPTPVTARLAA